MTAVRWGECKIQKYFEVFLKEAQSGKAEEVQQARQDGLKRGSRRPARWNGLKQGSRRPARVLARFTGGPGNELKKMIAKIGIHVTRSCSCNRHVQEMNEKGPDWCFDNVPTIVAWMRAEAKKRKLVFLDVAAAQMVKLAVRRYRKRVKKRNRAKSAMSIVTVVTTAPREGGSLAQRCVDSLRSSGFDDIIVCAEPDSEVPGNVDTVFRRGERLGAWRNWLQSLQDVLESRPDADAIFMVQDDVVFCRDLRAWLQSRAWPSEDTGLMQVGISRAYHGRDGTETGMRRMSRQSAMGLAGAWACLFPRHVAYQIVAYGLAKGWRGHPKTLIEEPTLKKAIDPFIGTAVTHLGYCVHLCLPSLANHDAEHSVLKHGHSWGGARHTLSYPGDDVSAFDVTEETERGPVVPVEELSVVIPMAGECADLMESCLRAVLKYGGVKLRVVVVDNGCPRQVSRSVASLLRESGRKHRIVRNSENLGFTKAVNQGIEASGKSDVLLLNSDCRVAPNCLPLLYRTLRRENAAAVGPLAFDRGHQSLRHQMRRRIQAGVTEFRMPDDLKKVPFLFPHNTVSHEPMLAFFCALLSRDAIDDVGLLDEETFESGLVADDEWCHRARVKGWPILLHHGAFADHDHSVTFRRLSIDRGALHREAMQKYRDRTKDGEAFASLYQR